MGFRSKGRGSFGRWAATLMLMVTQIGMLATGSLAVVHAWHSAQHKLLCAIDPESDDCLYYTPGDVSGTPYEGAVQRLMADGVMIDYPSGLFGPTDEVSVAQMAASIARLLGLDLPFIDGQRYPAKPGDPVVLKGVTFRTRETDYGIIHYTDAVKDAEVDVLRDQMNHVFPEVEALFRSTGTIPKVHVYLWDETAFTAAFDGVEGAAGAFHWRARDQRRGIHLNRAVLQKRGSSGAEELLAHEYTHAVAYHLAGTNIPSWMDEGFAMVAEMEVLHRIGNTAHAHNDFEQERERVQQASEDGHLLSAATIDKWFNADDEKRRLAYSQSTFLALKLLGEDDSFARYTTMLVKLEEGKSFKAAWKETFGGDWRGWVQEQMNSLLDVPVRFEA